MQFEWNDDKNQANIRKHGIDFTDAKEIFSGKTVEYYDSRIHNEDRWQAIGMVNNDILFVVYVEKDEDTYRVISARRAKKNEQEAYYKEIFG